MKFALLFITMILCAGCAKAGNMADSLPYDTQVNPEYADIMNYTLGSEEADKEYARLIDGAQKGGDDNHSRLGTILAGGIILMKIPADTPLAGIIKKSSQLGVKENYVKAYAHFLLSDNFKTSRAFYRDIVAEHMDDAQIREAKKLAEIWGKQIQAK